ncbi:MAG: GatB/YqeY domain-containing protein [Desulfobacterales bacterium]
MDRNTEYGWRQDMKLSLHDKVRADLKKAMLEKNQEARNTLRQIMAEFPKLTLPLTLESGKNTTRLEAKGQKTSGYLDLLQTYLPKMAGRDEIISWITDNIDFSQFKNKMQAMGPVMKHFGKLADGKIVNQILKEWE